MTDKPKTTLEWTYEPSSYFGVATKFAFADGEITVQNGKASGKFNASFFDQREFRDEAQEFLMFKFFAQQVQVHKLFNLSPASVALELPDGRRNYRTNVEAAGIATDTFNITTSDKERNIIADERAERLEKQQLFRTRVNKIISCDPVLKRLLQSFNNAFEDKDNSLIHLFEVRDAIEVTFYSDARKARNAVGLSKADWNILGKIANHEPILEGRHRGEHKVLRKMTSGELSEALRIAQSIIEGYLDYQCKKTLSQ